MLNEHFVNDFGGKENSKQCKRSRESYFIDDTGITPNSNMSLLVLNLPEIHLMLGVGQKLYDKTLHSMSTSEIEVHVIAFKKFNIIKKYHEGSFEGNSMRLLLKHHAEISLNIIFQHTSL